MAHPDPYESWKQRRAGLGPNNLADRVMAALRRHHEEQRQAFTPRLHLLQSPAGRLAICSLAGVACLIRILQLVAPFLVARVSL
jgi:hypothetical protein